MNKDIVNYRRERAKETLQEARLLYDNDRLFAAVNRTYYAAFYEVNALILIKNFVSSKHSGVRAIFNKEFIKTGLISEKQGDFYNKIFGFRQRSDYEDLVEFEKEQVGEWLLQAEEFVATLDKKILELLNTAS